MATGGGAEYALYSFAPGLRVINGFIQALVGLYDFGRIADDDRARALYADGERVARVELPTFDTGAWSLYSRGTIEHESDLSYHQLLRAFLRSMCTRTEDPVYCDTELRFAQYELEPPQLSLVTTTLRGGTTGKVRLRLSKISRVGLRVKRADRVVSVRPAVVVGHGTRVPALAGPAQGGRLRRDADRRRPRRATSGRAEGTIEVLKPKTGGARTAEGSWDWNRICMQSRPPDHPLHGQGRRRQDLGGGCDRAPLRGRGPAHDRPLHGPRPLARGLARSARRLRADAGRRRPVGPAGAGAGRARAPLVGGPGVARRPVRRPGRRPHRGRGADRPAGRRRAVQPAAAQAPRRGRRLGRRDRRLRAHGRDAAAAVVPRRRALVARQGLRARAPAAGRRAPDRAHVLRRHAPRRAGLRRGPAPRREPDRDERDPARPRRGLDPARDDPRPHGHRRGDADLHVPVALRLPDRRRGGQPRLPARRSRAATSAPGARSSASSSSSWSRASPRCRCCARPTSSRRCWARRCSTGSATRCSTARTPAACCTTSSRRSSRSTRTAPSLRLDIPFADKGDISLKKIGLELSCASTARSARSSCRPRWPRYRPSSASFSDGSLLVSFSG